jgi:hypothetical protein
MRNLKLDYVIYDFANDNTIKFSNGEIVLYADKQEALNDCHGNEIVIPCTDLPTHWQMEILNFLNQ